MRYSLLVLTPPEAGASARHALNFARAVLRGGHELGCVFFFDAGVLTAATGCEAPQDEDDLRTGWSALAREHAVNLVACVASAHRFGVVHSIEAQAPDAGFRIAGLGDLVEAGTQADRLLTFRG